MSKEGAFLNTCTPPISAHLILRSLMGDVDYPAANRFELVNRPVTCTYRAKAMKYDYWEVGSDFGSCEGIEPDSIGMRFRSDKLVAVWITCGGIVT
jgi:hypothetical protein